MFNWNTLDNHLRPCFMNVNNNNHRLALYGGDPIRKHPLPWPLPSIDLIGDEELELVTQVIKSKSPFRFYGPGLLNMVLEIEKEWRHRFHGKFSLAVNSGTAAINIALLSLGVGPGDEVLVPGFMWVSCLSSIIRTGAIPRLVDVDDSFSMDPDDLKRKIGPHSKAVLLVHMCGASGELSQIREITKNAGLFLVEDCSQAIGASYKGQPLGSFGDLGIFSFQLNKNITCGEGGMIQTNDKALIDRCYALHDVGYVRNNEGRLETESQDVCLWGGGNRMSELSAAFLLGQIRKIDPTLVNLRKTHDAILSELSMHSGINIRHLPDPDGDSCQSFCIQFENKDISVEFVNAIQAEGIVGPSGSSIVSHLRDYGLHWYFNNLSLVEKRSNSNDGFPWTHPLNLFAENYEYFLGTLPNCDAIAESTMIHHLSSNLNKKEVSDVIHAYKKVAKALL
jgi:dTDP-4-amino-4,6-dideoxygalactose transaminase